MSEGASYLLENLSEQQKLLTKHHNLGSMGGRGAGRGGLGEGKNKRRCTVQDYMYSRWNTENMFDNGFAQIL
jgi:hypothetical protein